MILAQILIAIIVTTILSTAFIERSLSQTPNADKTIEEIKIITEAAQKYHLDLTTWPDESNACANAMMVLSTASSPTYLVNIDNNSPFNTPYITNCTNTHFSVEVTSTDIYAGYIANKGLLPAIVKPAPDTATTVITVAKPLADTIHDKFLALGDTTATAQIYDIDEYSIQQNGRDLLFIAEHTIDVTATPNEFVPKPICNSTQAAKVHLSAGTRFSAANNKAIFGWEILIDTANSNATRWALSTKIFTEDTGSAGHIDEAGTGTLVVAQTYCENV